MVKKLKDQVGSEVFFQKDKPKPTQPFTEKVDQKPSWQLLAERYNEERKELQTAISEIESLSLHVDIPNVTRLREFWEKTREILKRLK